MNKENTNSGSLIKAIASGNIWQMNKANEVKNKIDWEDMKATFYYLIREGERTSFYDLDPPLLEKDIDQMAEGVQIIESAGYKDVSLEALKKLAEVLDCYERLRAANQLFLIDKYKRNE